MCTIEPHVSEKTNRLAFAPTLARDGEFWEEIRAHTSIKHECCVNVVLPKVVYYYAQGHIPNYFLSNSPNLTFPSREKKGAAQLM